jgi:hypothetical protein
MSDRDILDSVEDVGGRSRFEQDRFGLGCGNGGSAKMFSVAVFRTMATEFRLPP